MALELAQARDSPHRSAVNSKDESASDGDEPHQPVLRRRKIERKCWQAERSFLKDSDEANCIRSAAFAVISVF
jgi:hypothetical protein